MVCAVCRLPRRVAAPYHCPLRPGASLSAQRVPICANIVGVDLQAFQDVKPEPGDTVVLRCPNARCGAMFSALSRLDDAGVWACEYCEGHARLPDGTDASELASRRMAGQNARAGLLGATEEPQKVVIADFVLRDPGAATSRGVVFVCDVSGSMSVTTEGPDGKYTSRLDALKRAVVAQLRYIRSGRPDTRVSLVTFGSNVTVRGGDRADVVISTGTNVDPSGLLSRGETAAGTLAGAASTTAEALCRAAEGLSEQRATALGPAVLVGIGIASTMGPGSRVIIVTDGVANEVRFAPDVTACHWNPSPACRLVCPKLPLRQQRRLPSARPTEHVIHEGAGTKSADASENLGCRRNTNAGRRVDRRLGPRQPGESPGPRPVPMGR